MPWCRTPPARRRMPCYAEQVRSSSWRCMFAPCLSRFAGRFEFIAHESNLARQAVKAGGTRVQQDVKRTKTGSSTLAPLSRKVKSQF